MPLIVVPTPIGNLEDITLRAIRVLNEADCIACEDTRRTLALLNHLGIRKPLVSYHEHNERTRTESLLKRLEKGETVALVSDAGTPGISDPGFLILVAALERGFFVDVLPGPNALLPALLLSGFAPQPFLFYGFLEGKPSDKRKTIGFLKSFPWTLVFYLSPHRLYTDLCLLEEGFKERRAALVREISKIHQETCRGTLADLVAAWKGKKPQGEFVCVIGPSGGIEDSSLGSDKEEVWLCEGKRLFEKGLSTRSVVKNLHERYGIPQNRLKRLFLGRQRDSEDREKEEDE